MICPLFRVATIMNYGNTPGTKSRQSTLNLREREALGTRLCIREKCAWWNEDLNECSLRTIARPGG
jgi:hypothetical protein